MKQFTLIILFLFSFSFLHANQEDLLRTKMVVWANALMNKSKSGSYKADCSKFVRDVVLKSLSKDFLKEIHDLGIVNKIRKAKVFGYRRIRTLAIYILLKNRYELKKTPKQGDIVFFDNTYDKNKNGKWDDILTHIGMITKVYSDGRCQFIHAGTSRGIVIGYFHLTKPDIYQENGRVLNSFLQSKYSWNAEKSKLAGQLVRGFGSLFKN